MMVVVVMVLMLLLIMIMMIQRWFMDKCEQSEVIMMLMIIMMINLSVRAISHTQRTWPTLHNRWWW